MSSANPQSAFDDWAPTYDRDVAEDGLFPFDGYDRVLQRLVSLADVRPGVPVLELGVGTANLTRLLADQGADVWGLDFSEAMLAVARHKVPSAHLAQADLLADFPVAFKQLFPVVVSSYVFHEFPTDDKRALLRRLTAEHLLPDGRILIGDIGFADAAARAAVRHTAGDRWEEEYYWLAAEAELLAAELGLNLTFEPLSSCGVVLLFSAANRT